MKKTKLLSFVIIALLLLNFGILGFLFLYKDKGGPKGKKMPREIVIEKLHFNDNQIVEYDRVIKIHKDTITAIDDSIKIAKNELYQLLNSNYIDNSKKENLYLKLAYYQKQIETMHFIHFLEIKAICDKKQLTDFKNLTQEFSKIFTYGRKPKNE